MPLADSLIISALKEGTWTATRDGQPVSADQLTINPNSVNLSLAAEVLEIRPVGNCVDLHCQDTFSTLSYRCDGDGLVLLPGRLYLASVREAFDCSKSLWVPESFRFNDKASNVWFDANEEVQTHFYPVVDGRSTPARACGLSVHATAGRGDWGFSAPFTLELTTVLPVRVREGDEIAQIYFEPLSGFPSRRYEGAYVDQRGPRVARLGADRFQRQGVGTDSQKRLETPSSEAGAAKTGVADANGD